MPARTAAWAGWIILLVGALVLFIGGGSRFSIGLALKPMEADLGSGRSLIGFAVALFQVVSACAMFWAGRLADRMDVTRVLALGVLLGATGIGALAWAQAPAHVVALYGVVFALGNGLASVIPVGVLVTRHFPERAGLANAISLAGLALGQLVMMYALTPVLQAIGWRWVFAWIGIAHLAIVPLVVFAGRWARAAQTPVPATSTADASPVTPIETTSPPSSGPPSLTLQEALRTRRFWLLIAIYALCGFHDFFVSTHVVAFAQDRGADTLFAGQLLAFMGLAALVGVLLAGASADRFGPAMATALCFLVRIALFGAVLADQSVATVAVFALLFGMTFLVTAPLTVVFVRQSFGTRHLGAMTGLITMVHHIFGGLGAWIGALFFDASGNYERVMWMMMVSSAIAYVLTMMLGDVRRRAASAVA